VHFLMGMDEHGQKVLTSAQASGVTPQQWVDNVGARFADAWKRLEISNDDFIHTTEQRHHRAVHEIIRRIHAAGDFYRGTYAGYYCVGCEAYKTEAELEYPPAEEGEGPPFCPIHPSREIQWLQQENWFFRLSAFQDRLLKLLGDRPEFIQPEIRRNEIRRLIESGLQDISVSRTNLPWGIPWPDEPGQTVYVWLDALTNYLSATGFPDPGYERLWPADVHVIGKDITRFHCVYWPAFLMSAGLALPRSVWAHGFVTFRGRKESKSEGVSFDLQSAIEQHGPEALRYFLLREVPWNGDGDITRERFTERYTTELANDLGNLASRALAMIEKYRGGKVPADPSARAGAATAGEESAAGAPGAGDGSAASPPGAAERGAAGAPSAARGSAGGAPPAAEAGSTAGAPAGPEGGSADIGGGSGASLRADAREAVQRYREAMDAWLLHRGIQAALQLTSRANLYVEERAPWSQAKDPALAGELDTTLHSLAYALATLTALLHPFIPQAMEELASRLGLAAVPTLDELTTLSLAGNTVRRGEPLFPRADLQGSSAAT
jgi:methionyl-tRNA synthetase